VKLTHHVLMKESVKDVKAKLWNYLTEKGFVDVQRRFEISGGWLHSTHPQLVFRPAIETELNRLVSELPIKLREEVVAIRGTEGEETTYHHFSFMHASRRALALEKAVLQRQPLQ
jgi:hypothetical protein